MFKVIQKFFCVAGEIHSHSKNKTQGIFQLYDVAICLQQLKMPQPHQLDDERLKPMLKRIGSWNCETPISKIEQFGFSVDKSYLNNGFVLGMNKTFNLKMIQTKYMIGEVKESPFDHCINLEGHKDQITRIRWGVQNGTSPKLISSSLDGTVLKWDLEMMKMKEQMKYHKTGVQDCCFVYTPEGKDWIDHHNINSCEKIASVGSDGFLLLWDERDKSPYAKINCKQKELYSVACLTSDIVLTGGADGSIKFWDLRANKEYCYSSNKEKVALHFSRVNQILIHRSNAEPIIDHKKSILHKFAFSTRGREGKVVTWQEKANFVHEGHQNEVTGFDRLNQEGFFISAEKGGRSVMVWQPGVGLNQQE